MPPEFALVRLNNLLLAGEGFVGSTFRTPSCRGSITFLMPPPPPSPLHP